METTATLTSTVYASFGRRLVACIIDGLIIGVVYAIVLTPILAAIGLGVAAEAQNMENLSEDEAATAAMGMVGTAMAAMGTMMVAIYAIQVLYYALMESSKLQASIGKLAMGIKVVDMEGNRISIGKGFLRAIGKIISGAILLIGYLLALFTEKKQALHDMIANTLVLKK